MLDKEVSAAQSVNGLYWSTMAATSMLNAGYDLYAQRAKAPF